MESFSWDMVIMATARMKMVVPDKVIAWTIGLLEILGDHHGAKMGSSNSAPTALGLKRHLWELA